MDGMLIRDDEAKVKTIFSIDVDYVLKATVEVIISLQIDASGT